MFYFNVLCFIINLTFLILFYYDRRRIFYVPPGRRKFYIYLEVCTHLTFLYLPFLRD